MNKIRRKAGLKRRTQRALERQLSYQQQKANSIRGRESAMIAKMIESSRAARQFLSQFRSIDDDARVLEVGSGAHGLIFFFGARYGIGIDPLAHSYISLFPEWQRKVPTITAVGESLPFADQSFEFVLCDNVVDHAESPARIVAELVRVLSPGGLLYFTVNIHHPIYALVSRAHAAWNALGIKFELAPFADHTFHLTPDTVKRIFADKSLRVMKETNYIEAARVLAHQRAPRHPGDRLKRIFFKNALYQLVAIKEDPISTE